MENKETLRKGVKRTEFPLSISKKKGIDEFVSQYSPQKVEEEKYAVTENQSTIARLLERYEDMLYCWQSDVDLFSDLEYEIYEVLSPPEINAFLQATIKINVFDNHLIGWVVSELINNSFQAGHRNFYLNTKNLPSINSLMAYGGFEEQVFLKVEGCVGYGFGRRMKNLHAAVTGNVDDRFARDAQFSCFTVYGKIGENAAENTDHCTFFLHGTIESDFGRYSRNTQYKTPDKNVYSQLIHSDILREGSGNKVFLLDEEETADGH